MKRKLVQCRSLLNRKAVRRESIDGVEHVIVSSFTMPDDIIMNGGLYPASEIASSFHTLERTLAPIEHPSDKDGNFLLASDPIAINDFYAGAYNKNVTRENGRVHIEKYINVQEAIKSDRGKRLMDRIVELETNDKARPIHTSTGILLSVEELDEPKTNAAGEEYSWIAHDMAFDHDAILLDSVAAAPPSKGVGMAVNEKGERFDVETFELNVVRADKSLPLAPSDHTWDKAAAMKRVRAKIGAEDEPNARFGRYHLWFDSEDSENFGAYKLPFVDIIDGKAMAVPNALRNAAARLGQTKGPSADEKDSIQSIIDGYLEKVKTNAEGMGSNELRDQLHKQIDGLIAYEWMYIADIFDDVVVFETNDGYYQVPYRVDEGVAKVVGIPLAVDKDVTYTPKVNKKEKGDVMNKLILNALKDAGIETEGLDDAALLAEYNKLMANESGESGVTAETITEAVNAAVKPLTEKIGELEGKLNSDTEKEIETLAGVVGNSDKHPGLTVDSAKLLPIEELREMASACGHSVGVPFTANFEHNKDDKLSAPAEMPDSGGAS